jgi:hypothetical protein
VLPQAVRSNPAPDKSVKARTIFLLILFLLGKYFFDFDLNTSGGKLTALEGIVNNLLRMVG